MDQICLVVPILPGRTADTRTFTPEPETGGQRSEQRTGIVKQAWYLAPRPQRPAGVWSNQPCPAIGISRPGPRPCTPTTRWPSISRTANLPPTNPPEH